MASLDAVGGFCSGIKKSNYLPEDFSNTTTITQRIQIPKNPKFLFDLPYYTVNSRLLRRLHSKAILLQVVIVFHNNAKKPWFKEWRIAFGRRRIFNTLTRQLIKKSIKCFKYQEEKEPSKTS